MNKKIDISKTLETNSIKQGELARYLGVSKGYISQVLSGKTKLSAENTKKLIEHPGWKIVYLSEEVAGNRVNGDNNVLGNNNNVHHCDVVNKLTDQNSRLLSIIEEQMQVIKNLSSR